MLSLLQRWISSIWTDFRVLAVQWSMMSRVVPLAAVFIKCHIGKCLSRARYYNSHPLANIVYIKDRFGWATRNQKKPTPTLTRHSRSLHPGAYRGVTADTSRADPRRLPKEKKNVVAIHPLIAAHKKKVRSGSHNFHFTPLRCFYTRRYCCWVILIRNRIQPLRALYYSIRILRHL